MPTTPVGSAPTLLYEVGATLPVLKFAGLAEFGLSCVSLSP